MAKKQRGLYRYFPEWVLPERKRTVQYNPAKDTEKLRTAKDTVYTIFDYNKAELTELKVMNERSCRSYYDNGRVTWINVDGLKKKEVEALCGHYHIHPLIVEDILSIGQRAKMDETGEVIFCLLPMLYFNGQNATVETEQVSIVVGKDFVVSFQEDPDRDVFDPVREKLRANNQRLRESGPDYLCYCLLDVIVDSYFNVIEQFSGKVEALEDDLMMRKDEAALARLSLLRRELLVLKRSIMPVRELVSGFIRTEHKLIDVRNEKYYKDVSDHIIQANEYCDSQRETLMNLQDLYMNQVNLRMNEVMKIFTMISLMLAPATVIGGIFGMNFDKIPGLHNTAGFFISVSCMLLIPVLMLIYFKKKGWF